MQSAPNIISLEMTRSTQRYQVAQCVVMADAVGRLVVNDQPLCRSAVLTGVLVAFQRLCPLFFPVCAAIALCAAHPTGVAVSRVITTIAFVAAKAGAFRSNIRLWARAEFAALCTVKRKGAGRLLGFTT